MKTLLLSLLLLTAVSYGAQQTILLTPGGTTLPAGAAMINANFTELYARAFDSDITIWAGITPSANGASLVSAANYAAMRTLLDLEAGTDFNAYDADLATWATITPGTGIGTWLATPSSANLRGALTDESGTGVFLTVNGAGGSLTVTAAGFDGNLATTDDTVQEVAQKLDDLVASSGSVATDTIFDAAGDLVYGTGSNTAARLAIGTAGQILQVNAGATAPEWTGTPSVTSLGVSGAATVGSMSFEGATADANETALAVTDPTADRTITLPDATGTVALAQIVTKSTASSYTIGTTDSRELYGGTIYVTGAATITIPAVAAGASFTVITIGAVAVSVDPNASDLVVLDGTALADGDKVTNTSAAGDIAVFTYYDGTGWYCASNGWTDGN